MVIHKNASSTRHCSIWRVMVATALTVRPIAMDQTASVAKRTTTCDRMATVSTVIAIRPDRDHCSATAKGNANVNQVWPVKSVTGVKPITLHSANTVVNRAVVIHAVHSTMFHRAMRKLVPVRAKRMSKGSDAKSVDRDSLVWIWRINSDARHASAMAIHQSVKVRPAIRSFRPHQTLTNTRRSGQPL